MVASDRVSAFDVVMRRRCREKARCSRSSPRGGSTRSGVDHHLLAVDPDAIVAPPSRARGSRAGGRGAPCSSGARAAAVECVVRGTSPAPRGRSTRSRARWPVSRCRRARGERPARRPAVLPRHQGEGTHDENIPFGGVGSVWASRSQPPARLSLRSTREGARYLRRARHHPRRHQVRVRPGPAGMLLIDEVITPDSSRFWPREKYAPGRGQPRSTSSRSATGWTRCPGGTRLRRLPSCRTRSCRQPPERYLESSAA